MGDLAPGRPLSAPPGPWSLLHHRAGPGMCDAEKRVWAITGNPGILRTFPPAPPPPVHFGVCQYIFYEGTVKMCTWSAQRHEKFSQSR